METDKCLLFKSNTFMNQSGRSISAAFRKLESPKTGKVLVIYDDLELGLGQVKLRTMGKGKYVKPFFSVVKYGVLMSF